MSQKAFLFDQTYCTGCQACVKSCNARHDLPAGIYPRWADSYELKVYGPYMTMACNHCDNPACVAVCPVGALTKREDGIVVHDPDICIGCMSCLDACPYDAPKMNEATGKMVKCDMCAALLDAGREPACVLACPLKVLKIGEADEFIAEGATQDVEGFEVAETGPNLYFVG